MTEPVRVLPMAKLLRLAKEKEARDREEASQTESASQTVSDSLTHSDRQTEPASQTKTDLPASQNDRQTRSASQTAPDRQTINMVASLPDIRGHLRLPNKIIDALLPQLDTDEQAVYLQLYRLSRGFGKATCRISLPKLSERTNIKSTSLKHAIKRLEGRGLITKTEMIIGYQKEQGIEYWVADSDSQSGSDSQTVRASQTPDATNKRKHYKENTHKEVENNEAKEIVPRSVSVGSKFSTEECRKYAEHLRTTGQGITNPGGYATTIHRTGEADQLIEKFFNANTDSATQIDSSNCPDCHGTGFWYPAGVEQGVAKCPHSKLTSVT